MNKSRNRVLLLLTLLLSGCSAVSTPHPFGKPVSIEELKKAEGTWVNKDGNLLLLGLTREDQLMLGSMHWNPDGGRFEMEQYPIVATQADKHRFAFLNLTKDPKRGNHLFCLYSFPDKDRMQIHHPDVEKFAQAVAAGTLAGNVSTGGSKKNVTLDAKPDAILKFLMKEDIATYFDKKPKEVLYRLQSLRPRQE